MDDDALILPRTDPSGLLHLDALRPVALRAGRLAEALFDAAEADVVIVQNGAVWRGKPKTPLHNDVDAAEIAMAGEDVLWLEDTHLDARWRDHPQAQGPSGVRFCASAPIVLKTGVRLGALRVFDNKPRPFDADLADRLKDLAAAVVEECDRLVGYQQEVLRTLFEQSPGFAADFEGENSVHQIANPAYIALVGPRPVIGVPGREALPELITQGFFDRVEDVYKTGRPYAGEGERVVLERTRGAFEERYLDFVLQPIHDLAGEVSSVSLQGVDVTQERRSVEALKASQIALEDALAATQAIFDHSLDIICTIDADGLFTQVSKNAVNVWGYTAQELIGRAFIELVHPDDRAATLARDQQIVIDGIPTSSFQNRYIHKNGSTVPMAWSSVWSAQHQTLFCVARDMRESLAAEEKLRQAQKMEAVGRLTGGVAHDFNNLLTIIIGAAETLIYENKVNAGVTELAEMIRSAGERGSGLTSQLLAFARRQPLKPRPVNVSDLLCGMEGLLARTLGEDIELLVARNPAAWRAMADPVQLELAVLNLAINARDAMPSGGKLTIEAVNVTIDRAYSLANDVIAVGDYVIVAVTDSGEGMSQETVRQAFEPFFTTKPPGKGTGLGLSMVQGFVRQSEGNVKIYSELGVGTTIRLYLPRAGKEEMSTTPITSETGLPKGSEHILLVEDEDLLRDHARRQLESLGYRVTVAANGPEALELIETLGDFDLLFTDVVMPDGLNGRQLADQIHAKRPGLKVLYTSGYSENAIAHQGRLDPDVDLLSKPYRKRELAVKVRNVLDGVAF